MKVIQTELEGCFTIEPQIFKDERGVFFENFNKNTFRESTGLNIDFVQDNQSISNRGVIRGLHLQLGIYAQAKLVSVARGKVLDVVIDVRENSKTFGNSFRCILSDKNKKQLFIPKGFLHGFSVLEDNTIFTYKCDNYYNKNAEDGVVYDDSDLNIDWNLKKEEIIVSEKDKELKPFCSF